MKRILVAVDFSDVTEAVIVKSVELAKAFGSKVCIVHIEMPDPEYVGYGIGPLYVRNGVAQQLQEGKQVLHSLSSAFDEEGIECKCLQMQGMTTDLILMEAVRFKADLLVVGSHEHGVLHHLFLGSVRENIIARAHCPVLVVPPLTEDAEA